MGQVTDELIGLITKQVDDHGIVVWYDPEKVYREVAEQLGLPDTTLLRCTHGFFELRHRIDPLLEFVADDGSTAQQAEVPPRLVVYVPIDRSATRHALAEIEAAGVVMEPGANPWQRNTRLKVIAERVFKQVATDRAADIVRKVEESSLSLAELDWLSDQTGDLGAVKLIFGTTAARDVATMFASSEERDATIEEKRALGELADLFRADLGVEIDRQGGVTDARRLCRGLLLGELAARCERAGCEVAELATAVIPRSQSDRQEVMELCQTWRNRADLHDAYIRIAEGVEGEAGVAGFKLTPAGLEGVETFLSIEKYLFDHAEMQLLAGNAGDWLKLARRRKQSFWATVDLTNQLRWSLLETASSLMLTAARVETELKSAKKSPAALVKAYAQGSGGNATDENEDGNPWCLLDTHHRHLERQYALFDLDVGGQHDGLEKVIAAARQRYTQVVARCAEAMTDALLAANFELTGVLHQSDVFSTCVAPRCRRGKTAYVLADALRYEMGRELVDGLGEGYEVELAPAVAQLPTITEVGMSAALPGAEKGMELVKAGPGKVAIQIGLVVLKDRASRMAHLAEQVSGKTVVLKLNDLMKPSKKQRSEIEAADFVLVTSQEIDRRGEKNEDEEESRRYMNEVLDKLRRGIRALGRLGIEQIVLIADHGHLFGEVLDSGLKMDPPGGKTTDLHRRVWIGNGGGSSGSYVRVAAGQLGLGGGLELAFPRGLGCFKVPGGSEVFFHGGTSLQELVVPVALIQVTAEAAPEMVASAVTLTMDKPKISNRLFSVVATYTGGGLFAAAQKRVKVLVQSNREEIGRAATAAYGFEDSTQEIVLQQNQPNAITVMLTGDPSAKSVTIHVIDAASQVELAALKNVPVDIAI